MKFYSLIPGTPSVIGTETKTLYAEREERAGKAPSSPTGMRKQSVSPFFQGLWNFKSMRPSSPFMPETRFFSSPM